MNGGSGRRSRGTRGNVFRLGDNVSIFLLGVLSLTGMIVVSFSLVGRDHKTSPIHLYVGGQGLVGGGGVGGCGPCLLFFCLFVFQKGSFLLLVLLFFGKVVHHLFFYRRFNAGGGIELRHACLLLLSGQLLANGVGREWVVPGKHGQRVGLPFKLFNCFGGLEWSEMSS